MKINSINENSETNPSNNCDKNFTIDWKSLKTKSVDGKFMEESKTFVYEFSWEIGLIDSIAMDIVSSGTKTVETNWIDLKSTEIDFQRQKLRESVSIEVEIMQTAFVKDETKTKPTSLTGTLGEPISNKCNV